jgi:hypothetical protein
MKLFGTLLGLASAQYGYDYYSIGGGDGRIVSDDAGHGTGGLYPDGNGKGCHGTKHKIYNTWMAYNGDSQPIKCRGLEYYCAVEERAQFGQITGINAGCKDHQNEYWVSSNWYDHVSGCISNMAQNGEGALAPAMVTWLKNKNWMGQHDWYQNQCKRVAHQTVPFALLPIGTSKCYVCCVATDYSAANAHCNWKTGVMVAPDFSGTKGILDGGNIFP